MTKLVVLGILKRRPYHGYEIKRIIQVEMGDWTNIAFGSIYFALAQLVKEGCIKQMDPEIQDARPAKIVYKITEKGEKEFTKLLTDNWKTHERQYFSLDMGIYFSQFMKKAEMQKYLKKQMFIIRMALRHIKKHQVEECAREEVPAAADSIFSHTVYHMRAEYLWLKETLSKVAEWKGE